MRKRIIFLFFIILFLLIILVLKRNSICKIIFSLESSNEHTSGAEDDLSTDIDRLHLLRKYESMQKSFFRIPSLVATNSNRLILGIEQRIGSIEDQGLTNFVIRRSTPDKSEWEAPKIVLEHTNVSDYDMWYNSTALYSKKTGRLIYVLSRNTVKLRWQDTHIVPNPQIYTLHYIYSDDDGATFSAPVDITSIYPPNCVAMLSGVGSGIEMENGTLVMPIQCKMATSNTSDTPNSVGFNIQSGIMYSVDNGLTWTLSNLVPAYTSECMVVEYEPNKIMLNARGYISKRRVFTTNDLGATWTPAQADKTIIEPTACQASFYKYKVGYKSLGLFCNPHSTESRINITLQSTTDYINYHPIVTINTRQSSGYTSIASDNDGNLYIVYESDMNGNIYLACLNKYIPFMLNI